ncbi:MAG: hypothetical protein ACFFED_03970 [Candidatus Thorarchaeota archaeon]
MSNRETFIISVIARLVLVMLLPFRITMSTGVTTIQLIATGLIWELSNDLLQWQSISLASGLICSIPALEFSIYFRSVGKRKYPLNAAIVSSLTLLAFPVLGHILPSWIGWLFYVPLVYSVALILCFILIPSLYGLLQSSEIRLLSVEALLLAISFVMVLGFPCVFLYNQGLYGSDRTLLSSVFLTFSSVRSGWSEESGFYLLENSSLVELEQMLSSFQIIFILRLVFLLFIALYLGKRLSIAGVCFAGILQEVILLVIANNVNAVIIMQPYYSVGASPLPYLFPLLLLLLVIHWRLRRTIKRVDDDEVYITIPLMVTIKHRLNELRDALHRHQEPPSIEDGD